MRNARANSGRGLPDATLLMWAVIARRKGKQDLTVDSEVAPVEMKRKRDRSLPKSLESQNLSDTSERTPSWMKKKRRKDRRGRQTDEPETGEPDGAEERMPNCEQMSNDQANKIPKDLRETKT